jgi:excisionase family DNA binding protein
LVLSVFFRYYPLLSGHGKLWLQMAIWLDLDHLVAYLGVPKSTLYKLLQRGELPGHKIGKLWRFDRDEVDEYIKSGGKKQAAREGNSEERKHESAS